MKHAAAFVKSINAMRCCADHIRITPTNLIGKTFTYQECQRCSNASLCEQFRQVVQANIDGVVT